jgi:hypothetical protein
VPFATRFAIGSPARILHAQTIGRGRHSAASLIDACRVLDIAPSQRSVSSNQTASPICGQTHNLAKRTVATLSFPSFFAHNPRVPFQLLPRSRHHRHITRITIATAQDARENPHNDTCRNTFIVNATQLGSHGSITPVDPHIPGSTTLDIQIKPQSC